jgi:hypothetical protein
MPIWMYRTTVRRTSTMTRAEEAVDTTAIDAKAAAGKDTPAVGKPAADMKERWPRDETAVAAEAATGPTACDAQAHASVSLCQAAEVQRGDSLRGWHRTGRRGRGQNHLRIATDRSGSWWLLRKKLAVEARAHVADDVDDAMPASGHTGGHARATPEEEAAPASRPSGGARQGGAARREAHLGTCAIQPWLEIAWMWERCSQMGRIRLIWRHSEEISGNHDIRLIWSWYDAWYDHISYGLIYQTYMRLICERCRVSTAYP